MSHFR